MVLLVKPLVELGKLRGYTGLFTSVFTTDILGSFFLVLELPGGDRRRR
jgi:hypothetical protein